MSAADKCEGCLAVRDRELFSRIKRRFLSDWVALMVAGAFVTVGIMVLPTLLGCVGQDIEWRDLVEGARRGPLSGITLDSSGLIVPLAVPASLTMFLLPANLTPNDRESYSLASRVRLDLLSGVMYWILLSAALVAGVAAANAVISRQLPDALGALLLMVISTFFAAVTGPRMGDLERSSSLVEGTLIEAEEARKRAIDRMPIGYARKREGAGPWSRVLWVLVAHFLALLVAVAVCVVPVGVLGWVVGATVSWSTAAQVGFICVTLSIGALIAFVSSANWRTNRKYSSKTGRALNAIGGLVFLALGVFFMTIWGGGHVGLSRLVWSLIVAVTVSLLIFVALTCLKFHHVVRYEAADVTVRNSGLQLAYLHSFSAP